MMENRRPSMTATVLLACLPFFVLCGAGFYVINLRLQRIPGETRYWIAAVSSCLIALAVITLYSVVTGSSRKSRTRAELLRRAMSGGEVADGEPIVATGTVRVEGEPLRAPISGRPCAAYLYKMFFISSETSEGQIEAPVYWGFASRPFVVDGIERRRVGAIPRVKATKGERLSGPAASANAKSWAQSTQFTPVSLSLGVFNAGLDMAREVLADVDGFVRKDFWREGDEHLPGDLLYEELLLAVGEQASVYGTWNELRGEIVAGGGVNGLAGVAVIPGGDVYAIPSDIIPSNSTTSYVVAMLIELALGIGLIWLAENKMYPM